MTDYFSRFVEIGVMQKSKTSSEVVRVLKAICARHGIPKEIRSDSGLQYDSAELAQFTKNLEIKLSTSSPRYPRANREVERAVRTCSEVHIEEGERPNNSTAGIQGIQIHTHHHADIHPPNYSWKESSE